MDFVCHMHPSTAEQSYNVTKPFHRNLYNVNICNLTEGLEESE
jgi:hypothetical protein